MMNPRSGARFSQNERYEHGLIDHSGVPGVLPSGGGSDALTDPTDIADCALWLDASTLVGADGSAVTTWPDLSGNGFDATQASADHRPTLQTNELGAGLHVVRFAGGATPDHLLLSGAGLDLLRDLAGCTVAFVGVGTSDTFAVFLASTAASDIEADESNRVHVEIDTSVYFHGRPDEEQGTELKAERDLVDTIVAAPTAVVGAWDFVNLVVATTGRDSGPPLQVNTVAAGTSTPDTASAWIAVGGLPLSNRSGDLAELIVYQRALTGSERRRVYEYLSDKWATL